MKNTKEAYGIEDFEPEEFREIYFTLEEREQIMMFWQMSEIEDAINFEIAKPYNSYRFMYLLSVKIIKHRAMAIADQLIAGFETDYEYSEWRMAAAKAGRDCSTVIELGR